MYDEKCLSRVGRNVKALRLAARLGQEELARQLGVSQTHMCNLECGRAKTSLIGLLRLANVFDCSLDVLLDKKAALKLAAKRIEAHADDVDEAGGAKGDEQGAATEAPADVQLGGVYSLEDVRQLLELLHKARGQPLAKQAAPAQKAPPVKAVPAAGDYKNVDKADQAKSGRRPANTKPAARKTAGAKTPKAGAQTKEN